MEGILEYLQLAYYKTGQVEAACRAVASFLLFEPNNEEMKFNKGFYANLENVTDAYFKPRTVSIESAILNFLNIAL